MTSDLHDRLDRLAGGAPDRLSSDDLWERGVRRGRRQRVAGAAAAVAAVVLVVALGGSLAATFRSPGIAPAPPGADQVRLPASIVAPGERARTATLQDGPPGRLVAVVGGYRGTLFSSEMGLYGVSATTGEYIWLDLPDLDATAPVDLSPDGMHVGYWLERGEGSDPGTREQRPSTGTRSSMSSQGRCSATRWRATSASCPRPSAGPPAVPGSRSARTPR